ncbi:Por secretion system C-terminal sorting domain-containing protein [Chitinophaga terrae (ex Kim and Jung 2007)]|uniref:Por secretion system C-terminal sorting domain-containing protein n=1 Tax=Chitinophaga terrae (ex Kim and Jung 2007) TaxID=408074 RepID=A0A1H4AA77_9BACT|nr:T9SS type A sorting domain-containing protein [Chitinophaga terrae (ex Kim and Jung 2007)]GEP90139.1 hypothetical protein CTE07_17840 [Chitinophaga terrae (ex Kim and Jung 2007)]SEA32895.1 Por secretion system C-terminal sorting domain-containing protein [Chitinophaga terrae (ex Kim and Jung 2007)]
MSNSTRAGTCLLFLFILCSTATRAQIILNRYVTATSGGEGTVGAVKLTYTIGEPIISFITDGHFALTQGFQQPEELPPVKPGTRLLKEYLIFPNPASTNLKIQMDLLAPSYVQVELINTAGQTLYSTQPSMGAGRNTLVIGVNRFASGIYTLKLQVGLQIFFEKVIIQ